MERNSIKNMMNVEAFVKVQALNDDFIIEAVADAVESFTKYVQTVDQTETLINIASVRYEGEEYREMIMRYDRMRKDRHEEALANVAMLNRIAAKYNINDVFIGDVGDRYAVADFCLDIVEHIKQK